MIVKFDGKDIKESRDLPRLVASMAVGKEVEVVVMRKGKEMTKTVTLGRLEDGEKQMAKAEEDATPPRRTSTAAKALGMSLAPLGDEARKTFKLKDSVKGVVVSGVEPNSPAAEKGLRPGDVIEEVNQQAVEKPADVSKAIDGAEEAGQEVGAAAGRQRRGRSALRRAGAELRGRGALRRRSVVFQQRVARPHFEEETGADAALPFAASGNPAGSAASVMGPTRRGARGFRTLPRAGASAAPFGATRTP